MSYDAKNNITLSVRCYVEKYLMNLRQLYNDKVLRQSFINIFIITNLVFLFHSMNFFWGNHDWYFIKNAIPIYSDMFWIGRFSSNLMQQFTAGEILPLFNNLFCFFGFTLATISLSKYWNIPKSIALSSLFGICIIILPYTFSWLWYVKQTTVFWNVCFCVWALMLSEKYSLPKSILSIILVFINLSVYQSLISTLLIIFLIRCLLDYIYKKVTLKNLLEQYITTITNIYIGVILYAIVFFYYKGTLQIPAHDYNTELISLNDAHQKILYILKSLCEMFYISQPYMSSIFKLWIFLPLFFSVGIIIYKKKPLALLLVVAILLCSQITIFLAKAPLAHFIRIDFFSVPYIVSGFTVICLRNCKIIKNFMLFFLVITIYLSVLTAGRWQKVNFLGWQAEQRVYADIIHRIKHHPNFKSGKTYIMLIAGDLSLRHLFYHYNDYQQDGQELLRLGFVPAWDEKVFYDFYEANTYIETSYKLSRKNCFKKNNNNNKIINDAYEFIIKKAKPYPDKDSVYVDDEYIYVIYNEAGLEDARRNLLTYLNK